MHECALSAIHPRYGLYCGVVIAHAPKNNCGRRALATIDRSSGLTAEHPTAHALLRLPSFMRLLFGIGVVVCMLACNKADDAPVPGPTLDPCGAVAGIQRRDVNGVQIGSGDTTDWRPIGNWCDAVEGLFADRPPVNFTTTAPDSLLITAFPNPTENQFVLGFYRDSGYVDVRFVNANFELLHAQDSIVTNQWLFRADTIGITTPQTIRAYYRVVYPDGTAHRGHGDLQVDP